jgi:hypothetical protein
MIGKKKSITSEKPKFKHGKKVFQQKQHKTFLEDKKKTAHVENRNIYK